MAGHGPNWFCFRASIGSGFASPGDARQPPMDLGEVTRGAMAGWLSGLFRSLRSSHGPASLSSENPLPLAPRHHNATVSPLVSLPARVQEHKILESCTSIARRAHQVEQAPLWRGNWPRVVDVFGRRTSPSFEMSRARKSASLAGNESNWKKRGGRAVR